MVKKPVLMLMLLMIICCPLVKADDFEQTLQGIIGVNGHQFDNTAISNQSLLRTTLDSKLLQIKDEISTDSAQGRLKPEQVTDFSLRASDLSNRESSYLSSSNTTNSQIFSLARDIQRLLMDVEAAASNTVVRTTPASMGDLDKQKSQLEQQINEAATKGTLSWDRANNLLNLLHIVSQMEATFRASNDGYLTSDEGTVLISDLNRIKNRLDRLTQGLPLLKATSLDEQMDEFHTSIVAAKSAGTITYDKAERLRKRLDKVMKKMDQLSMSGNLNQSSSNQLSQKIVDLNTNLTDVVRDNSIYYGSHW